MNLELPAVNLVAFCLAVIGCCSLLGKFLIRVCLHPSVVANTSFTTIQQATVFPIACVVSVARHSWITFQAAMPKIRHRKRDATLHESHCCAR